MGPCIKAERCTTKTCTRRFGAKKKGVRKQSTRNPCVSHLVPTVVVGGDHGIVLMVSAVLDNLLQGRAVDHGQGDHSVVLRTQVCNAEILRSALFTGVNNGQTIRRAAIRSKKKKIKWRFL